MLALDIGSMTFDVAMFSRDKVRRGKNSVIS